MDPLKAIRPALIAQVVCQVVGAAAILGGLVLAMCRPTR